MSFLLALDEGTTSARAVLYDEQAQRVALAASPLHSRHPHPGWVEQDAEEIWRAQVEATRRVLEEQHVAASSVAAIGITNQRETTIVWDRQTGQPVAPAIVWQCRRTADQCAALASSEAAARITACTGLVVDAYFSATKLRWILDHVPDASQKARDGELLFGTVDTWLVWRLTNGALHVTDATNASRTMLMDLRTGEWSDDMLSLFDIPRAMLPTIVSSSGVFGHTAPEHLGAEIPLAGIAGDQQAALEGQRCIRPGLCKNTYGTGCFALLHTGPNPAVSRHRLLSTRVTGGQFALEGSVFVAGAAIQWLRDKLGLLASAPESELIARAVPHTGGVYLVPAFVGLGAPHWNAEARGLVTGMTLATGKAELVRAALESIAYQSKELVDAMQADSGSALQEMRVDGGAAKNDFLMQFQADILKCRLVRPLDTETTALGAALLAGQGSGFFPNGKVPETAWQVDRVFEPDMPASQREALYEGWQRAVARSMA